MNEPLKMVYVNIISLTIVLVALIFIRYIYPKKRIPFVAIVFALSIPPIVSIFREGTYESGDLSLHTVRAMSYFNILINELVFPPRWTPEFNAGYGDPHFLFSYQLPYILVSLFHLMGFPFLIGMKLLLASSYVLSGVFMYLWVREELNEKSAIVSSIFYLYAPYHLIDLHFRASVAEVLSYVFLPLAFLFAKKIISKPSLLNVCCEAITICLLILSHQAVALMFFPIITAYGVLVWTIEKRKHFRKIAIFFSSLLLGLLLAAYYWIPAIFESKHTQTGSAPSLQNFESIQNLLFSPWRYGFLFQGPSGELALIIGYSQLIVAGLGFIALLKYSKNSRFKVLLRFFILVLLISVFMITPYSSAIWNHVPLIKHFQYSYRFLLPTIFCIAFIAGLLAYKFKNFMLISVFTLLTILYTILNWGNRGTIPAIKDSSLIIEYQRSPDVGDYLEPTSPILARIDKPDLRTKPDNPIATISGGVIFKQISRTSTKHEYVANAFSKSQIRENTLYFPGWKLLIDNVSKEIDYTTNDLPGIITFTMDEGLHHIELRLTSTLIQKIAITISIVGILIIILLTARKIRC